MNTPSLSASAIRMRVSRSLASAKVYGFSVLRTPAARQFACMLLLGCLMLAVGGAAHAASATAVGTGTVPTFDVGTEVTDEQTSMGSTITNYGPQVIGLAVAVSFFVMAKGWLNGAAKGR